MFVGKANIVTVIQLSFTLNMRFIFLLFRGTPSGDGSGVNTNNIK